MVYTALAENRQQIELVNLKVINNTFTNKSRNPESLKKYSWQFESSPVNVHIVGEDLSRAFCKLFHLQFGDSSDQCKKSVYQRFYLQCERYFYMKIPFLLFLRKQKQNSDFLEVGGLVTRNISAFCWQWIMLFFKAIPNSIDFYKGIFLNVILVQIIVPCFH